MHKTVTVARGQVDVGDAAIQRMCWVDREVRGAIELGVSAHGTKIAPAGEGLSCLDFKGSNGHRAPPSVCSGNAAPDPEMKSNRMAGSGRPDLDRIKSRCNGRFMSLRNEIH